MSSVTTATFIPSSEGSLEGKCSICDIIYKTRQSFNHHRRTKHLTETAEIKKGLLCPGQKCDSECANYEELIEHLKSEHGIDCAVETRNFDGLPQCNDWIASLELETNCSFVNGGGGVKQGKDSTRLYKRCSRSGRYTSTAESSKNTRKKGTRKIQAHCPAYIRLNVDKNSGIVSAKMCLTHVGHETSVKYIDLPKLLKNDIARLLNDGHDNKTIVSKLHAANSDPTKDRGYYLTEKHVDYYRKKLGFASGRPDLDDHVAVDLIVKQYENDDNSPVFFYKPIVASDDKFALGLQTTGQRRLLDELGSNVISIDTTHNTTRYKYLLCTLMVLDEAGGGQPAAEFFIESESESDLLPLFQALKLRHPSLNPAYFMSDCASAFWNAWQKVFDGPEMRTKRIMCDWHIWRAWNGQMQNGKNKISTAKQRRVVRKCLAALMNEDDEAEFRRKYDNIVNDLWIAGEESVKKFREYFLRYYPASTAHDWARFGRLHSDIATNMHLEAYHRVLKQRFLNRNYRNRLDVLLSLFIDDVPLFYERRRCRVTVMEEIVTSRQQLANRDHDAALYYILNPTEIRIVDEDHWQVESRRTDVEKEPYDIRRLQKKCPSECQMFCRVCNVCPHMYTCTCFKNTHESGRIACAHIHAVHYMVGASADDGEDDDDIIIAQLPEPPVDSTDESVLDRTIEFVSSETDAEVPPSSSTQGSLKDAIAEAAHLKDQLQTWLRRHENADGSASAESMVAAFKQMKDIFIEATAQDESPAQAFEPIDKSRRRKMSPQRRLSSFQQRSKKRAKAMTEEEIAERREENEQLERFLELQEDADFV